MSKIKYDQEIHFIKYSSLYEDEKMKQIFLSFLDKERNKAPFLFYFECTKTIEEESGKKIKMYQELCNKYIFCNNENQINLPNNLFKSAKNLFDLEGSEDDFDESLNQEYNSKLLELRSLVFNDLYMDSVYIYLKKVFKVYQIQGMFNFIKKRIICS
jgi:hypothetical protein